MELRIYNILEKLKIKFGYQIYDGNNKAYAIYRIAKRKFVDFADDETKDSDYFVVITWWVDNLNLLSKHNEIIEKMHEEGFECEDVVDDYDDGYFGKIMKFNLRMEN